MIENIENGIKKTVSIIAALKRPTLILVAGPTCSGKNYFAFLLQREVAEKHCENSIVCQDDYFRDADDPTLPKNEIDRKLFDTPDSYRNTLFIDHIILLLKGENIWSPKYNIATNKIVSGKGKLIRTAPVVTAEGLYTIRLLGSCRYNMIKIYVHAAEDICLRLKTESDAALLGVTPKMVEKVFEERILPYQRKFVEPQKEMADIIIVNNERRWKDD